MKLDIGSRAVATRFPRLISWPSLFEDDNWLTSAESFSGLSMSVDDKQIFVEAALPGIDPKDVEVTFDNRALWIRGQAKEEEADKQKQYYRKASRLFSYRVVLPDSVDETSEPQVVDKNGLIKITFQKITQSEPKKLKVKTE